MSLTGEALVVGAELRRVIGGIVDAETRRLVAAWSRAWDAVAQEWRDAADILSATPNPTRAQIDRALRASNAARATVTELERVARQAGVSLTGATDDVVAATRRYEARQIAAQMPPLAGSQAALAVRFDRVNPRALEAIVGRTTQQITSLTRPLPRLATQAVRDQIVRGIPQGLNPREVARRMLRQAETAFNGGLTRALTISWTEMLDAYRAAAAAQERANEDVLAGWVWHAELDHRVCMSCAVMHGDVFDIRESGPDDHQRGRCARMPATKSWRDLGFDLDDPPSPLQDGRTWFDSQPESTQLEIAGPGRLKLYQSGRAPWRDLSTVRHTPGWRTSRVPTPVHDLAA